MPGGLRYGSSGGLVLSDLRACEKSRLTSTSARPSCCLPSDPAGVAKRTAGSFCHSCCAPQQSSACATRWCGPICRTTRPSNSFAYSGGAVVVDLVYYCVADFTQLTPHVEQLEESENEIVAGSDVVFTNCLELSRKFEPLNPNAHVFPFGVNLDAFPYDHRPGGGPVRSNGHGRLPRDSGRQLLLGSSQNR